MMRFVDLTRLQAKLQAPLPPDITALRAEIERRTVFYEREAAGTGPVNMEAVEEIVRMKLELDQLCARWLESP